MRMARLHTGRHKVLAAYRSYHGATAGAITADRRPAPLAERAGDAAASCTSGAPTPTARRSTPTSEAQECERALQHLRDTIMVEGPLDDRRDHARDRGGHQRHPRAAGRLPRRRPRDLRRARHRLDRRRGHGRLRPLRRVVRRRPLGRHPRPDLLRQGRQLRLRAARRRGHLRRHRRRPSPSAPSPAASPTRATRSPARRPSPRSGSSRRRASSRTSARLGDTRHRAAAWPRSPHKHPSVGEVRGLGFFWALELVRDRETREPLVPYNAGGRRRRRR